MRWDTHTELAHFGLEPTTIKFIVTDAGVLVAIMAVTPMRRVSSGSSGRDEGYDRRP